MDSDLFCFVSPLFFNYIILQNPFQPKHLFIYINYKYVSVITANELPIVKVPVQEDMF